MIYFKGTPTKKDTGDLIIQILGKGDFTLLEFRINIQKEEITGEEGE